MPIYDPHGTSPTCGDRWSFPQQTPELVMSTRDKEPLMETTGRHTGNSRSGLLVRAITADETIDSVRAT